MPRTLAVATRVPEQEVHNALSDIAGRVNAARNDPAAAGAEVRRGVEQLRAQAQMLQIAERVQNGAAKPAWAAFAALILSLGAAVLGYALGRRRAVVRVSGVRSASELR